MKLIVDADPIVYRAGFAAEQRHYQGVIENDDGGSVVAVYGTSAADLDSKIPEGWKLVFREPLVTAEPVSHALQNVDMQMQGIVRAVQDNEFTTHRRIMTTVLLTGPGNFREKLATIRPYKGNRDPQHKPVHYQAIRNHLTHVYGAHVVHGREADDEVSILAHAARREGQQYCVATIDKDLDQVPGLHYDYRLHVFYTISEADARRALWVQILGGDAGDNVPGCYGIGRERSARMIDNALKESPTDLELWDYVVACYADSQKKAKCPYKDADPWDVALETARLVFIQRVPGEVWYPTGPKVEAVNNYED